MNANPLSFARRRAAGAVLVAAVLAGCSAGGQVRGGGVTVPTAGSASALTSAATSRTSARVVLRFGDELATAALADTAAAQEFTAMLPLQLTFRDPMGQAKSGPLPRPIDVSGAATVTDPTTGDIYYWPASSTIAIFYDDLGQTVPPPGVVRLGTVDSGLEAIAGAGIRFTVRIYPIDHTSN